MRALLALAVALTLAACGPETAPDDSTETVESGASNPTASGDSIPAGALVDDGVDYDQPVQLVSMESGDRACYLTVRPDGGPERTDMAAFGLCERTELVGQRVALTVTPSPVMAESCGGNPECTETEQVNLVTGLDLADGEAPSEAQASDSTAG